MVAQPVPSSSALDRASTDAAGAIAAADTGASSPLSSAPPSPSILPQGTAPFTATIPFDAISTPLVPPMPPSNRPTIAIAAPFQSTFPPLERAPALSFFPLSQPHPPKIAPVTTNSNLGSAQLDPCRAEEQLKLFAHTDQKPFETYVGLYFQESRRLPYNVGKQQSAQLCCQEWLRNPRVLDILASGGHAGQWEASADPLFMIFGEEIARHSVAFEAAILWWAMSDDKTGGHNVARVLQKIGFLPVMEMPYTSEWVVMDGIFKMAEGKEREKTNATARKNLLTFSNIVLVIFDVGGRYYILRGVMIQTLNPICQGFYALPKKMGY